VHQSGCDEPPGPMRLPRVSTALFIIVYPCINLCFPELAEDGKDDLGRGCCVAITHVYESPVSAPCLAVNGTHTIYIFYFFESDFFFIPSTHLPLWLWLQSAILCACVIPLPNSLSFMNISLAEPLLSCPAWFVDFGIYRLYGHVSIQRATFAYME
jgi:hypothetical protein